ncbi:TetR/AcrR family transcriptional regulator [Streptomyces sp. NBC_01476]|uniref:TetR/AcrR family transcriptional regulator n=1 Tax=Streptomyces sp. NBC_01476 TaxID=2903881 RepID=UPI002E33282F|nr:helix-turn-helix domain-containing protein [Streptomyces sp. NBC_01476]
MAAAEVRNGKAGRALRVDAERNRERLLRAAQCVFAERGLSVPLDDIAARAGVGIATLYRRFPTREELVGAAFEAKLLAYAVAAEEALAVPDPWASFAGFVERICAMQAGDRGFTDLVTMSLSSPDRTAELRERAYRAVARIIGRAQQAGVLRDDVVVEDLPLMLLANAGVVHATRDAAPHAWRRLLAFLLDGFRPAASQGPMPAPPTPAQMDRVLKGNVTAKGVGCPDLAPSAPTARPIPDG